jgi:hypothetical protein
MFVPTTFRAAKQWPEGIIPDDPVNVDWQARLMDALADAGFRVLCKPHPDTVHLGLPYPFAFSRRAEFRDEPFEAIWGEADAFLFDYPITTTFWHALCSRKPVVLLDHGLLPWQARPHELMARRCRVVPAWFDEDRRLQTDVEQVLRHLREPVGPVDLSFVQEYMVQDLAWRPSPAAREAQAAPVGG